jgi:hypothetical protein
VVSLFQPPTPKILGWQIYGDGMLYPKNIGVCSEATKMESHPNIFGVALFYQDAGAPNILGSFS